MKKVSKLLSMGLATLMVAGALSGCGSASTSPSATTTPSVTPSAATPTTAATPTPSASTNNDVQELNLRAAGFGTNFDVQDMGWRWMMAACYEGLLRDVADENGDTYVLAGAEKINVSEDGLTYTFNLRKDAKWSDGKPVTAADYVYGWTRLLNPDHGYHYSAFIFNVVGAEEYYNGTGSVDAVGVKAVDDYTFEVKLKIADPTFETKLVATPLYPTREDIAEAAGENWGKDWKLCVYNGPFVVIDIKEDNKMVWEKNQHYWDAANVKLEKVNWFAVPEAATAATMFENGQLDVISAAGDYIAKFDALAKEGKVQSMTTKYPGTNMLCFEFTNGGKSGLVANVNIRKAISYSISREEIVSAVYGRYVPAYGLIAPAITFNGTSYRDQSAEPALAEYEEYSADPAKLQALFQKGLDELGVTTPIKDVTITLLTSGSATTDQNLREYLQQSIENNIGCKVELNTVGDYSMFTAEKDAFNYDIMTSGWWSDYNDPLDFLHIFKTGIYESYGLYSNKDFDAMLDSLDGLNDMSKRFEIYQNLEKMLLVDDCAFIPMYYNDNHFFIQNWVKDFHTSSFGASQEVYKTYIEGK